MANFLDFQRFTDFADGLSVTAQKRQITNFNDLHGQILVVQVFLLNERTNPDGFVNSAEYARQFTQAATFQGWPSLIRDGLLQIATAFRDLAVPVDQQVSIALPGSSDVDQSDSLRRLIRGQAITSAELMDALPLLVKDPSTIHQHSLPERLYKTYVNTSNVPLREALLPVLGQATVSLLVGDRIMHTCCDFTG